MPDALACGDVIACRQAVGVVWRIENDHLVVLPIGKDDGGPRHRGDVPLELMEDQAAAGVFGQHLVIHADMPTAVATAGKRHIGKLPGPLACKVSLAIIRSHIAARNEAKWKGEKGRVAYRRPHRNAV
jgi:hypothetical protein